MYSLIREMCDPFRRGKFEKIYKELVLKVKPVRNH